MFIFKIQKLLFLLLGESSLSEASVYKLLSSILLFSYPLSSWLELSNIDVFKFCININGYFENWVLINEKNYATKLI